MRPRRHTPCRRTGAQPRLPLSARHCSRRAQPAASPAPPCSCSLCAEQPGLQRRGILWPRHACTAAGTLWVLGGAARPRGERSPLSWEQPVFSPLAQPPPGRPCMQDPEFLRGLLLASIVPQKLTAAQLAATGSVTAADGRQLAVTSQSGGTTCCLLRPACMFVRQKTIRAGRLPPTDCPLPPSPDAALLHAGQTVVGQAGVVLPDIQASNGIIHITGAAGRTRHCNVHSLAPQMPLPPCDPYRCPSLQMALWRCPPGLHLLQRLCPLPPPPPRLWQLPCRSLPHRRCPPRHRRLQSWLQPHPACRPHRLPWQLWPRPQGRSGPSRSQWHAPSLLPQKWRLLLCLLGCLGEGQQPQPCSNEFPAADPPLLLSLSCLCPVPSTTLQPPAGPRAGRCGSGPAALLAAPASPSCPSAPAAFPAFPASPSCPSAPVGPASPALPAAPASPSCPSAPALPAASCPSAPAHHAAARSSAPAAHPRSISSARPDRRCSGSTAFTVTGGASANVCCRLPTPSTRRALQAPAAGAVARGAWRPSLHVSRALPCCSAGTTGLLSGTDLSSQLTGGCACSTTGMSGPVQVHAGSSAPRWQPRAGRRVAQPYVCCRPALPLLQTGQPGCAPRTDSNFLLPVTWVAVRGGGRGAALHAGAPPAGSNHRSLSLAPSYITAGCATSKTPQPASRPSRCNAANRRAALGVQRQPACVPMP